MFYSESKQCWIERVTLKSGKKKEITAKTQNALAKKLVAFNEDQLHGRTFAECADGWERTLEDKLEDTTVNAYTPHVKRATDFFAGKFIKDITPDEVQAYVDYLADCGFAKDTVRRGLVVLNKIFKWAITQPDAIIRFNPCGCVEIRRGLKQTQREPPEPEQIEKITPDTEMGLFAYFLLCTGLRPCELLALRWDDIDRDNMRIRVCKSATYGTGHAVVKDRTKTKAGMREVPLLDALNSALPKTGKGYIFGGDRPYDKQKFYREWTKWCASIGLADEIKETHYGPNKHPYTKTIYKARITPYQFRHEYASLLEDLGVSEFDAQHIMGHSSIVITKDKYTKFRAKKNKNLDAATKLNAYFNEKVSSDVPEKVE